MPASFGAEDMNWVEPDDDSLMQDAIHRNLIRYRTATGKPAWRCGICACVVTQAHFKRHLKKHDREGEARSKVDAAWREFVERPA